jgi:hypothetical protein
LDYDELGGKYERRGLGGMKFGKKKWFPAGKANCWEKRCNANEICRWHNYVILKKLLGLMGGEGGKGIEP